jgi:hypothetical protein
VLEALRQVTLFVGPSAWGLAPGVLAPARLRPPIRGGDIDRLLHAGEAPGITLICDGVCPTKPAVSHGEICRALDAGWQVWGVSGIGAIRAHEMRAEGVRGHGYVYSLFKRLGDVTDDEMCLLHDPEAPYLPLTEPLVNLRFALEQRGAALHIDAAVQAWLLERLGTLWYGERTEARIRSLMLESARIEPATADALLAWLKLNRIQSLDLASMMAEQPWRA